MASKKINLPSELAALEVGDAVLLTRDGKTLALHVVRIQLPGPHTSERVVTVGYGPGRWNTEVSIGRIRAGFLSIERG